MLACLVELTGCYIYRLLILALSAVLLHQLQCFIVFLLLLVKNLAVVAVRVLFLAGREDTVLLIDPPETLFDVLLNCVELLH